MKKQASHGTCLDHTQTQPRLKMDFDYIPIHNYSFQEIKQNSLFPLVSTYFKKLLFKDHFQQLKNYATT